MLKAFDAPSREECTARRPVSNTPLQALSLLNDPSFVDAARVFAARVVKEGGATDADRARWAWREVLGRAPSDREAAALTKVYRQERDDYDSDRAAAEKLLAVGQAPRPKDVDAADLAAWTMVSRVLSEKSSLARSRTKGIGSLFRKGPDRVRPGPEATPDRCVVADDHATLGATVPRVQ